MSSRQNIQRRREIEQMHRAKNGLVLMVAMAIFTACAGDDEEGEAHGELEEGEPSGAICPSDSTLSYATFGESFMSSYCTSCHSSELTGKDRNDAPSDHNFDTLEAIHDVGMAHIDLAAAAGPDHVNTLMPPAEHPHHPSEAERAQLGEWLACGAPE
jgi:uncharacterized membrane protein